MKRERLLREVGESISHIDLPHALRIGIDGIDAAGKSTFAAGLAETLFRSGVPVLWASIDDFPNPEDIRYSKGRLSPYGYYHDSFDYPVLISRLLGPLGSSDDGANQLYPYDFQADQGRINSALPTPEQAILLFDGIFLSRPELTSYWDLVIFLDITFEECLARALHRDSVRFGSAEIVRERYLKRYIPAQKLYLAQCQPKQRADAVINNEDPLTPELIRFDLPFYPGKFRVRSA